MKMKLLVIGAGRANPFPGHYGMEQAIDKLGGEFISYDEPNLEKVVANCNPTHVIVYANISKQSAEAIGRLRKIKRNQGFISNREKRIAQKKNKIINKTIFKISWWFWDLRHIENYKAFKGWQDMIFLCNKEYMEEWNRILKVPVYYMPQCATKDILYDVHNTDDKINWDIFFMGSPGNFTVHGDRHKILAELGSAYKLEIRSGSVREKRIRNNHASPYFYRNSKFCIDISANAEGYTSNRPYEILANKGFLLIKYYKGIEDIFENHKHCVWFKNIDGAKKEIDYYMNKPKERNRIAEAGHKLFLEKHTFDCRLKNILDIMNNKTKDYYGYL